MKRFNSVWYDVTGDNIIRPINYSRWLTHNYLDNTECAWLQSDGMWYYSVRCTNIKLCTICSVENTPVFSLKGVCVESGISYNYYMNIDSKNEIYNYEGYKNNNISNGQGKMWSAKGSGFNMTLVNDDITTFPVGRLQWHVHDEPCKVAESKYMTFSQCEFGKEFTCDSGHCIDVQNKCDYHGDCEDNSDEKQCSYIIIPQSYKKLEAPNSTIHVRITIQSVHEINTIDMMVELTTLVSMKWYDGRLKFKNLNNTTKHLFPNKIAKKIWNPLDHVVHERALIGKIFLGKKQISVETETATIHMDAEDAYENRLFDGYDNIIEETQRTRIHHDCTFDLTKFPFDTQHCDFKVHIMAENNVNFRFLLDDNSISYIGPEIVKDFYIKTIEVDTGIDGKYVWFIYTVTMKRSYSSQIMSTFLPTWLVWFVAYLTFFIKLSNFNNRFMGSVTSVLVLAALFTSMQNSLPKTSYFKYIDCWFLWYITNSILMITCHVIFDNITFSRSNQTQVSTMYGNNDDRISTALMASTKKERMNRMAIILFPMLLIPFNVIYFILHFI